MNKRTVKFYYLQSTDWRRQTQLEAARANHHDLRVSFWKPRFARPFAPGRLDPRIMLYTVMHAVGLFASADYGAVVIADRLGRIVHSSLIMPGFSRFPFMSKADLHIGATETRASFRGKGLAVWAIDEIVSRLMQPGRGFWYLTDSDNTASTAVAEKAGFSLYGIGARHPRLGIKAAGYYDIARHDTKSH